MPPVYSTKFVEAPGFSGAVSYRYTVPAGFVAVVKSLSIVWGNVTLSDLDAWFQTDSLAKLTRVAMTGGSSNPKVTGGSQVDFGSWVLEAGQELGVATADGTCDFFAGGYLLTLP